MAAANKNLAQDSKTLLKVAVMKPTPHLTASLKLGDPALDVHPGPLFMLNQRVVIAVIDDAALKEQMHGTEWASDAASGFHRIASA